MRRLLLAAALLALAACAAPSQPANLGELKLALLEYQRSGAYARDLASVAREAEAYVRTMAGKVARPALVLDIDETALSNWPTMPANDFGYIPNGPCDALPAGPCGASAWELSGRAEAIAPTLALFRTARASGVAVFFITGRTEDKRAATARNLSAAGYDGWAGLVLKPQTLKVESAADYKAPEREKIEASGYRIIANVGDQPSDLAGGHALRSFLLPNPFYRIR